ncbi:hypothetical protein D3C78_1885250 [compost metagenome]
MRGAGEVEHILQQGAFDHRLVAQVVAFVDFAVGGARRWPVALAHQGGVTQYRQRGAFKAVVEGQVAIEPAAHHGRGIAQ